MRGVLLALVRPQVPVVTGARQERADAALADELVEVADLVVRLAGGDDERRGRERVRGHAQAEHADAVDRSLRDEVARELAVLGIAPGALAAEGLLRADGE